MAKLLPKKKNLILVTITARVIALAKSPYRSAIELERGRIVIELVWVSHFLPAETDWLCELLCRVTDSLAEGARLREAGLSDADSVAVRTRLISLMIPEELCRLSRLGALIPHSMCFPNG